MVSLDQTLLAAEARKEPEEVAEECLGLPKPGAGDHRSLLGSSQDDPSIVDRASMPGLQPDRGGRQGVLEQRENEALKNRCLIASILYLVIGLVLTWSMDTRLPTVRISSTKSSLLAVTTL